MGGLLSEKYLDREQEEEWEGLFECLSFRINKIPSNCGCVSGSSVYLGNNFPAKSRRGFTLFSLLTTGFQ